jgi:hypothetical protein
VAPPGDWSGCPSRPTVHGQASAWYMTPEAATLEYRHYLANVGFKTGIYWTTLAADRKAST